MSYILNSKFPFFHEFKYPLMQNWNLEITGIPPDNAERFVVDLCGICDKCNIHHKNIIFHFNPRIIQNYVARNSFLHEQWGIEESQATRRSPFKRGETFILEFFVSQRKYLVSVNGKHFCSFQHRLPPSSVQAVEIHGDVVLKRVDIAIKESYPTQKETLYPSLELKLEKFGMPVTHCLPDSLAINTIIEIKGRVQLLPHEFYINLQNGTTYFPHPIIPYHISMRWRPLTVDSTIVNSWISGQWDEEVVFTSFLRPNSEFFITIYVKKEGFSTVIKAPIKPYSIVLPLFAYKTDLSMINTLHIQGDVQLYSIDIKKL